MTPPRTMDSLTTTSTSTEVSLQHAAHADAWLTFTAPESERRYQRHRGIALLTLDKSADAMYLLALVFILCGLIAKRADGLAFALWATTFSLAGSKLYILYRMPETYLRHRTPLVALCRLVRSLDANRNSSLYFQPAALTVQSFFGKAIGAGPLTALISNALGLVLPYRLHFITQLACVLISMPYMPCYCRNFDGNSRLMRSIHGALGSVATSAAAVSLGVTPAAAAAAAPCVTKNHCISTMLFLHLLCGVLLTSLAYYAMELQSRWGFAQRVLQRPMAIKGVPVTTHDVRAALLVMAVSMPFLWSTSWFAAGALATTLFDSQV